MDNQLSNLYDLAYYDALSKQVQRAQRETLLARMYYAGYQPVSLTDRQKNILETNPDNPYRINICRIIVDTLANELNMTAYETNEEGDDKPVERFANDFIAANKIQITQTDLYNYSLSEREAFVMLDWNDGSKPPAMFIHRAYTSMSVSAWDKTRYGVTPELIERGNGDGQGIYIKYENNDRSQKIEYAVQYWNSEIEDNGKITSIQRRTIYYPDRIRREYYDDYNWREYEPDQLWVMRDGTPIGIPVIPFYNRDTRCEFWDVMSLQDMVNKTLADLQASLDFYGFRIMVISGAYATTDGKPPASNNSNVFTFQPGMIMGFGDRPAGDVSVDAIPGEDPMPLLNMVNQLTMQAAQLTGTPTTKFTATAQVASAETLKEQKDSLNQRAKIMRGIYGDSWTQVINLAMRINNAFGAEQLDESVTINPIWRERVEPEELREMIALGASQSAVLLRAGYTQAQIDTMQAEPANRIKLASDFWTAYNIAAQSGVSVEDFARFVNLSDDDIAALQPTEILPTESA